MSAPEDWLEKYRRRQEESRRRAEAVVRYALPVLRFLGVEHVEVPYDGAGDSGTVKDPTFAPPPLAGVPEGLGALVIEAVEGLLPSGWEINAGSFGSFHIDVPTGVHHLDHNFRDEEEYGEDGEEELEEDEGSDA
jgi:hypothetical protein